VAQQAGEKSGGDEMRRLCAQKPGFSAALTLLLKESFPAACQARSIAHEGDEWSI
jgi:hypothetical protein